MAQNGAENLTPAQQIRQGLGETKPDRTDPAFQGPRNPLEERSRSEIATVIPRDVPIVTTGTGWEPFTVRLALAQLVTGIFDLPAQLVDSVTGDSRVQAALGSRVGGLLGRPVDFQIPKRYADSAAAKECADAFEDAWPVMAAESFLGELQRWAVMLGFGVGTNLWDMGGLYATPHPQVWHPRFTYYHWQYRCFVAITQDGQLPIEAGDGTWILHAPHGEYRGWMRGAVRAVGPWWLARNYGLRDWQRWSERHGFPIILAKTPAAGDPVQIAQYRAACANLGQESVAQLPQGTDGVNSYGLDLLEAKILSWEGFKSLIGACDSEITLALLAQNLTTEVKEGSFAAARVHADVRQSLLEADARGLTHTIYKQLSRPFAWMNFGEADLAPRPIWNVKPYEDDLTAAQTLLAVTQAVVNMANAGHKVADAPRLFRSFGIDIGKLEEIQAAIGGAASSGADATSGRKRQRSGEDTRQRHDARARFTDLADRYMQARIDGGASQADIETENEALAAMIAASEMGRGDKRQAMR